MLEKKNVPLSENEDGAPSGTGKKKSSHRLLKTIAFT